MVAKVLITTIGSLSNDDGDGKEKGKKAIGLGPVYMGGGGGTPGGWYNPHAHIISHLNFITFT